MSTNSHLRLILTLTVAIATLALDSRALADDIDDPEAERAACLERVWAPGTIREHEYQPAHLQCHGDGVKYETYFWEVFTRWGLCVENLGNTVGVIDVWTENGRYAEILEVAPHQTRCVSPRWGHGKIHAVNIGRTDLWANLKDLSTRAVVYRVPLGTADILP